MKPPVLLRIYLNEKLEGVRQFTESQVVIGRNPEAQVNLPEESVSPLHALIEERESGYYLSDLGSQTGTICNGDKVLDVALNSGDEIRIGTYKIQFFIGVPKPAAPPRKDAPGQSAATPAPTPPVTLTSGHATPSAPAKPADPIFPPAQNIPAPASVTPVAEPKPVATPASVVAPPPSTPAHSVPAAPPAEPELVFTPASTPIMPLGKTVPAPAPTTTSQYPTGVMATPKAVVLGHDKKHKSTFAPPSAVRDPKEILKPGKGTVVQVSVTWRERIISSYHFNKNMSVTMGAGEGADILVPLLTAKSKYELIKIGSITTVYLSPEMTGELITEQSTTSFNDLLRLNRLRRSTLGFEIDLSQGEMLRVGLHGDLISIYIRYTPESPKPIAAPMLDLSAAEITGVVLATVVAAIFGLYMMVYAPSNLEDDERLEEKLRMATVTFSPPPPKPKPQVQRVEVTEKKANPTPVKVVQPQQQTKTPSPQKDGSPGKAGEVAPKETTDKEKKVTSARSGGATKTAPKDGANAQSQKVDPTKVGLLGVFGKKGTQDKLDKAYSGSGELIGMAESATGFAGSSEDRAGDRLGTKLKDTGAGGKGSATVGISGVGTQGKGTGSYGLGSGGIGTRGKVEIEVGGQEAEVTGTIDREAIRRVVQANIKAIQFCYETALQRDKDLYGKLVLEWDIAERGRVTRAVVKSSTLSNNQVATCIINRLKTWTFPEPPPNQIAVVAYPFVFSSQ